VCQRESCERESGRERGLKDLGLGNGPADGLGPLDRIRLASASGFRVQGSKVSGLIFVLLSCCFRVSGRSRFRVQGTGFRVQGSGFRVQGSGFGVWG